MNILEIIAKKRDAKELSKEELLVHFMTKYLSCRLAEQR